MKESFVMPDIGEGITECELVKWLVKEGEYITEDQPVVDLMTDKTIVQIPSPFSGKVTKLHYQAGEIAKVAKPLFEITTQSNKEAENQEEWEVIRTPPIINHEDSEYATDAEMKANVIDVDLRNFKKDSKNQALATPYVRKIAKENNININDIQPSFNKEKITEADIYNYIKQQNNSINTACNSNVAKIEKMNSFQKSMAAQVQKTINSIPHFTYCEEIIADKVLNLKEFFKQEKKDIRLTTIFIKALSLALEKHPVFNSKIHDNLEEIIYLKNHNIGVAIDTIHGLIIPNIKDCSNKNIETINKEINDLIKKSKTKSITEYETKEGTVTISNIGAIGGTVTTPVINKKEALILATGRIIPSVIINDENKPQKVYKMHISWSADHRIVDGAAVAKLSNTWKQLIENPENILLQLS